MFPILAGSNPSGYNLTRSLRFRNSASAYLNRTPASSGSLTTWTWSGWVKRGTLGTVQGIFGAGGTSPAYDALRFMGTDTLQFYQGGAVSVNCITNAVFRDPSAWYHVVLVLDTTQATSTNRIKLYVNNVIQSFSTANYPALNGTGAINSSSYPHGIGTEPVNATFLNKIDGYLTEVNFINGQALTPSSFGSTNALTGVWQPARYTGTYGTNGFYLPFTDNSALTTSSNVGLGKDFSGNGNYWTTNNISITAGVTYDSMTDVPTLTSATAANFAVINPLVASSGNTLSSGNLTYAGTAAGNRTVTLNGSFKQYGEITIAAGSAAASAFGLASPAANLTQNVGTSGVEMYCIYDNGIGFYLISNGTTLTNIGTQTSAGVVFQIAYDAVGGKLWIGKNNVWFNSSLGTTGDPSAGTNPTLSGLAANLSMFVGTGTFSTTYNCNFGQRPFTYTPPTGFVALNTYNLPTSTIVKGNTVMDATLYTGTLLSNAITNAAAFKPDLVWLKSRSAATGHEWTDSVRGVTKSLSSNSTAAEATDVQGLTAFNTNGFTVGTNTDYNNLAATYVGWQWQAGQGSTSSNTNGTITSTVSVNASAGFSVVTFTGTGAAGTVGHGLGVAPSMYIIKQRSATGDWFVYHQSVGATAGLFLNLTTASTTNTYFNNTSPTSSVFSIGTAGGLNANGVTAIAYCWTTIAGYSSFGAYSGNGSTDGPMIYTGFQPKFVLLKNTNTSIYDWWIYDSIRNSYNQANLSLQPDLSSAETNNSNISIDTLSNGFKLRGTNSNINGSGNSYIYAAFATSPFKNSLAF